MPRCKHCKDKFEVKYFNQKYHLDRDECIKAMVEANTSKLKKETEQARKADTKERKEKIKTHSDYLRELQPIFNTFIRLRDYSENCISCQKPLIGDNPEKPKKFDAGHFRSVGSNPQLRFNEENVYGQCVHCNRDKHGNLLEYRKNLILKLGVDKVEYLENLNDSNKLSIPEIKDLITLYRAKIKTLKVG